MKSAGRGRRVRLPKEDWPLRRWIVLGELEDELVILHVEDPHPCAFGEACPDAHLGGHRVGEVGVAARSNAAAFGGNGTVVEDLDLVELSAQGSYACLEELEPAQ